MLTNKNIYTLILFLLPFITYSQVIYVDQSRAGGENDGSSWANAFLNLQEAITAAPDNGEIWIAKGTYFPSDIADQSISFQLLRSVSIYGGFSGNETNIDERDIESNETILSGDYDQNDEINIRLDTLDISITQNEENANNILISQNVSGIINLDGIVVEGGYASNNGATGAGFNFRVDQLLDLSIVNCKFRNNFAESSAGAFFASTPTDGVLNLTIANCEFKNNKSDNGGSAKGGAIWIAANNNSISTINYVNTSFVQNLCSGRGGALSHDNNIEIHYSGCLFENNLGGNGGAMFDNNGPRLHRFTNCTFYGNMAFDRGGAIVSWDDFGTNATQIYNCIFAKNVGDRGVLFNPSLNFGFEISNSLFEETDFGNILFTASASTDVGGNLYETVPGFIDESAGDFHISELSMAYNTGNNDFVASEFDLDGNPRINDGIVDIGCYEYFDPNILSVAETFNKGVIGIGPNPFSTSVSLELDEKIFTPNEEGLLQVFSTDGKLILSESIVLQSRMSLELSNLSAGLYVLNLKTSSNNYVHQIVKTSK